MSGTSIGHKPPPDARWQFDQDVADCFDDMLERSIPRFGTMRKACFEIGSAFRKDNTPIVDLGCSRGGALEAFVQEFGERNNYVGIDVSEPMLVAAKKRFAGNDKVLIHPCDLRGDYPDVCDASVTLAVLVLQFTPIEYRQEIMRHIYDNTASGGCVVLVEKVLGSSALIGKTLVDLYHGYKRRNGYSEEEIKRKQMALEGVLTPVTARWNEELLRGAGFRDVECFWRVWNFAGWVGVKQ